MPHTERPRNRSGVPQAHTYSAFRTSFSRPRDHGHGEPTAEAIIEEIIDPLVMGFPNIELRRVAPNAVETDYGQPEGLYVITVEPRSRGDDTERRRI